MISNIVGPSATIFPVRSPKIGKIIFLFQVVSLPETVKQIFCECGNEKFIVCPDHIHRCEVCLKEAKSYEGRTLSSFCTQFSFSWKYFRGNCQ